MRNVQAIADKAAISLSFICTIHCLVLPLLVVFLPTIVGLNLADETFHLWMLVGVIPTSTFALTIGCKRHQNVKIVLLGLIGLLVLIVSALWGHDLLGESGEKALSVLGACFIAIAHWLNHRLCQLASCECHS